MTRRVESPNSSALFLDDIIIFSATWEKHLKHLEYFWCGFNQSCSWMDCQLFLPDLKHNTSAVSLDMGWQNCKLINFGQFRPVHWPAQTDSWIFFSSVTGFYPRFSPIGHSYFLTRPNTLDLQTQSLRIQKVLILLCFMTDHSLLFYLEEYRTHVLYSGCLNCLSIPLCSKCIILIIHSFFPPISFAR